jgi:hypothetical protein
MSHLNIKFLKAQMASLQYGQQTEEEVCRAIEAEVCEGLFHDREQSEREHHESMLQKEENRQEDESVLQQHFADLAKHYADMVTFDPYVDRQEPEDTTNEY